MKTPLAPELMSDYQRVVEGQKRVSGHPVFDLIQDQHSLCTFMESHVFAVWDFMTLLKGLQQRFTGVTVPWQPAAVDKRLTRIINQLVLDEESDLDRDGVPKDHFTLYTRAMVDIGANVNKVLHLTITHDLSGLSEAQRDFVSYHIDLAKNGSAEALAGAFFYGRENLIPGMFIQFLKSLDRRTHLEQMGASRMSGLIYYFERHISIDGDLHQHMAEDSLKILCGDHPDLWREAFSAAVRSLELRTRLWDEVCQRLRTIA